MPFSIPLLDFLMSAVAGSDSLTSGMLVGALAQIETCAHIRARLRKEGKMAPANH